MKDWNTRGGWRCLWMFLIVTNGYVSVHAFNSGICGRMMGRQHPCWLQMSTQNEEEEEEKDEIQKLKESALRLRQEAQDLESSLNQKKPTPATIVKDVSYTSIHDSKWILTYRFANDPIQQQQEEDSKAKLQFFSGKVSVHFRSDGYTDILSSSSNTSMKFIKFWGWDEEVSPEDGNTYLLFSADVQWNNDTTTTKERFYFNAQVETTTNDKIVSLTDGKVTVKRELNPPGGRWGFFQTQGILAQFRYCGEFLCKPTSE